MNAQTMPSSGLQADTRFWDRLAPKYAKSKIADQTGYEPTLKRVGAMIKDTDQLLELGCGTGTTAIKLSNAAHSYLATDVSAGMITQAEMRRTESPTHNLALKAATAQTLRTEGKTFNMVLGFNYLHLVENLDDTLADIFALLKPGGQFVSKTPCLGDMNRLLMLAIPVMQWLGKAPASVQNFTEPKLIARLKEAGFSIACVEHHGSKGKDTRPFIVARKEG